jgi:hypothetical protein
MAEAWWMGAPTEIILDELKVNFSVDDDTARSSLSQGLDKLRAGGFIHA